MFKILATHSTLEILDQAMRIAQKTWHTSVVVDSSLYESAKFFVVNQPKGEEVDVERVLRGTKS